MRGSWERGSSSSTGRCCCVVERVGGCGMAKEGAPTLLLVAKDVIPKPSPGLLFPLRFSS